MLIATLNDTKDKGSDTKIKTQQYKQGSKNTK